MKAVDFFGNFLSQIPNLHEKLRIKFSKSVTRFFSDFRYEELSELHSNLKMINKLADYKVEITPMSIP